MQPTPRDQLVTDWVASRFPDQSVQITPASADASFRRYFRLTWQDGSTRILMDAPPEKEDCKPFIHVAGLLAKADLAAPRILDKDLDNGFLVLTDLGRIGYLDALNADLSLADMLIRPVLDVLVKWQLSSTASSAANSTSSPNGSSAATLALSWTTTKKGCLIGPSNS